MNKLTSNLIIYGIYGALATCLSGLTVPGLLGESLIAIAAFGSLMSFSMFAGNWLERKTWASLSAEQADDVAWRVAVRLSIYLLLPTVLVWLTAFTGLFRLEAGIVSAFAATFLPLMIATYLKLFPAGAQR